MGINQENKQNEDGKMDNRLNNYDWEEAFKYANFTREDVTEIIAMDDGIKDEAPWLGIFRLKSGIYGYLEAGCDYTGWDCRADGHSEQDESLENLIAMKMGKDDRLRLGVSIPNDLLTN